MNEFYVMYMYLCVNEFKLKIDWATFQSNKLGKGAKNMWNNRWQPKANW